MPLSLILSTLRRKQPRQFHMGVSEVWLKIDGLLEMHCRCFQLALLCQDISQSQFDLYFIWIQFERLLVIDYGLFQISLPGKNPPHVEICAGMLRIDLYRRMQLLQRTLNISPDRE